GLPRTDDVATAPRSGHAYPAGQWHLSRPNITTVPQYAAAAATCPQPTPAVLAERFRLSSGPGPPHRPHPAASRRAAGLGRRRGLPRQRRFLRSRRDHRLRHTWAVRRSRATPLVASGRTRAAFRRRGPAADVPADR